jgi:hypothetical protein
MLTETVLMREGQKHQQWRMRVNAEPRAPDAVQHSLKYPQAAPWCAWWPPANISSSSSSSSRSARTGVYGRQHCM